MSYLSATLSEVKPHKVGLVAKHQGSKPASILLKSELTLTEEAAASLVKRARELNLLSADGDFKLPARNLAMYSDDMSDYDLDDDWKGASRTGNVFGFSAADSSKHYLLSDTTYFRIDDGLVEPIVANIPRESEDFKKPLTIRCTIPNCNTVSFEASDALVVHLRAGKDAYLRFHPTGAVQWVSPKGKALFDAYSEYVSNYNEQIDWWQSLLDAVSTADAIEKAQAQKDEYAKMPMAWHVSTGKVQHIIATNGVDGNLISRQAGRPLCGKTEFGAAALYYEIECNGFTIKRIPYVTTCAQCKDIADKLVSASSEQLQSEQIETYEVD